MGKSIRFNVLYSSLLLINILFFCCSLFSQNCNFLNNDEYNFKKSNKLLEKEDALILEIPPLIIEKKDVTNINSIAKSFGCEGFIEDIGPALTINWNADDGSAPVITLPFNFCFYGETYSTVYMNNNGNISFGSANSNVTASTFPSSIHKVIAGFWADFTFTTCGSMHYNYTNSAAIFTWKDVGYFSYTQQCDKVNTLQIVITDGMDPLVNNGNVAIHYGDMNWTAGDFSQGINGLGGTPGSIGANRGNGVNYFQIGFFDHIGTDYDGPAGNPDGIDWLDNRSFYFDFCTGTDGNLAPIPVISENCTPYELCNKGDTLTLSFPFLSPENNQLTTVSYSSPTLNNIQIISNLIGFNGEITLQIPGDDQTIGIHDLSLTATDNAQIPATSIITYQVEVYDGNIIIPILPNIIYQNSCPPVVLSLSDTTFDNYSWSTVSDTSFDTIQTSLNENVQVLVGRQGCKVFVDSLIYVPDFPHFHFAGDFVYCAFDYYTNLSIVDSMLYDSVSWGTTINNASNDFYSANLDTGNYTIQLWDSTGFCMNDTSITINQFQPIVINSPVYTCDPTTDFILNSGGSNIGAWSVSTIIDPILFGYGDSLNTPVVVSGFGDYIVTYTDSFCLTTDSVQLVYSDQPIVGLNTTEPVCAGNLKDVMILDSLNMSTISWDYPSLSQDSQFNHAYTEGTYTIRLVNEYNCFKDTIVTITTYPLVDLNHPANVCGLNSEFDSNLGLEKGNWSYYSSAGNVTFDAIDSLNTKLHVSDYGTYQLVFTDSICQNKDTISLSFLPTLNVQILDSAICTGPLQQIYLVNNYPQFTDNISWNTGEQTTSIHVNDDGYYYVSISNFCGEDIDSAYVVHLNCGAEVPNIFTPNNDGDNDDFQIKNLGSNITDFTFVITDRWGVEIVWFNDQNFKWNGRNENGIKYNDGVYFYKMKFTTSNSKTQVRSGFFHLIQN